VTDAFDDAMFSLALRDRYPHVRFASGVNAYPTEALLEGPTIAECDSSVARIHFPPPDWSAEFEAVGADGRGFVLRNPPMPLFLFARSKWFWGYAAARDAKWAFSLPTLEHGHITCAYEADSAAQKALVRAVWRLLERATTNRLAGVQPKSEGPHPMADLKGDMRWAGHHALEWCAAEPDRMLDGCRRPADDWRFPSDPWLLDLRRRVAERWGPDYGAPPQEAPARLC